MKYNRVYGCVKNNIFYKSTIILNTTTFLRLMSSCMVIIRREYADISTQKHFCCCLFNLLNLIKLNQHNFWKIWSQHDLSLVI